MGLTIALAATLHSSESHREVYVTFKSVWVDKQELIVFLLQKIRKKKAQESIQLKFSDKLVCMNALLHLCHSSRTKHMIQFKVGFYIFRICNRELSKRDMDFPCLITSVRKIRIPVKISFTLLVLEEGDVTSTGYINRN